MTQAVPAPPETQLSLPASGRTPSRGRAGLNPWLSLFAGRLQSRVGIEIFYFEKVVNSS